MDVSIILPCFNEADILKKAVYSLRDVLEKTVYKYEIIIAEDSSTDGTDIIAGELTRQFDNIIWLHRESKRGRGSAVTNAIRKSRGRITGFIDVDLETAAHYIYPLILEIEKGADIATALRVYTLDKYELVYKFHKTISHYCYVWLSRKLLKTKLIDTETGCTFFNRERILPILDQIKDEHWFWDTEVMVRPYYKGYAIKEVTTLFVPNYARPSKVRLIKDSWDYLVNLFRLRKGLMPLIRKGGQR